MQVTLRIRRYNPERDGAPRLETYRVPAEPMDRVLDLLHYVKWNVDGSLTFRRSCAHGVCGSDAMLINGANREALPFLVNDEPAPDTERRQSPAERERFDDTTKCILCAACTTSCPVFWADEEYFGP